MTTRQRKRRPRTNGLYIFPPDELLINQGRETSLVEWILSEFGLQELKPELRRAYHDRFGWVDYSEFADCTMPFVALEDVLPGFPLRLESNHMNNEERRQHTQLQMYTDASNLNVYSDWLRLREIETQEGKPFGLCYNFGERLPYGLIIHDLTDSLPAVPVRCRIVIEDGPQVVFIEPFRMFIRNLAKVPWTLEQLRARWEPQRQREQEVPEADIGKLQAWQLARLNRKLKDKCAFEVLSLLLDVLLTPDAIARRHSAAKYRDGCRWVTMTRELMAKELRVSLPTVDRGLSALREVGLVLTRSVKLGERRASEYSVDFDKLRELLKAKVPAGVPRQGP
jgi:hypothetical protein